MRINGVMGESAGQDGTVQHSAGIKIEMCAGGGEEADGQLC